MLINLAEMRDEQTDALTHQPSPDLAEFGGIDRVFSRNALENVVWRDHCALPLSIAHEPLWLTYTAPCVKWGY
jgi:hypothetical protein